MNRFTGISRLHLRFDGENGAGGAAASNAAASAAAGTQQTPQDTQQKADDGGKTFTQAELNALLAQEKRDGKKSVLKELGFDSAEQAKKQLADFKAYQDAQKTAEQRYNDDMAAERAKTTEALAKALNAEIKYELISAGGNTDSAEEIAVLVREKLKADEKLTVAEAVKQLKDKVPQLFGTAAAGNSTGNSVGHVNIPSNFDYGKQLAERNASNASKENPYFKRRG